MPELIVLLGQENNSCGDLSIIALGRLEHAVALATLRPNARLLVTGTFGLSFNTSDRAHSHHLRDVLLENGIDPVRIIEARISARTLEDAFAVRHVLAEYPEIGRVTIVTSDYHLKRTRYLFGRVLPNRELEYTAVSTADYVQQSSLEDRRFGKERRDWISFPLLTTENTSTGHDVEVYQSAAADQQAYDRLSYAVVTGAFVSFFAPYLLVGKIDPWKELASYILSGAVTLVLFSVYLRMAMWANTARQVMYVIETQWEIHGFSYNARHGLPKGNLPSLLRPLVRMRIVLPLACIIAAMIAIQIGSVVTILIGWC